MRERVEDLGRISEMSAQIIEQDLWSWSNDMRAKDAQAWFESLPKEKQGTIINTLAYNIEDVYTDLVDLWHLARHGDEEDADF